MTKGSTREESKGLEEIKERKLKTEESKANDE